MGYSNGDSYSTASNAAAYLYSLLTYDDGSVEALRDVSLSPFEDSSPSSDKSRRLFAPRYGSSVAVHDRIILVGAPQADGINAETGVVFSYVAGIDYFPIGDNTYDFLVFFLPGAFISILVVSVVLCVIGNIMTARQRRYQQEHGLPKIDQDTSLDVSTTSSISSDSVSMTSSSRGLIS